MCTLHTFGMPCHAISGTPKWRGMKKATNPRRLGVPRAGRNQKGCTTSANGGHLCLMGCVAWRCSPMGGRGGKCQWSRGEWNGPLLAAYRPCGIHSPAHAGRGFTFSHSCEHGGGGEGGPTVKDARHSTQLTTQFPSPSVSNLNALHNRVPGWSGPCKGMGCSSALQSPRPRLCRHR